LFDVSVESLIAAKQVKLRSNKKTDKNFFIFMWVFLFDFEKELENGYLF